MMKAVYAKVPYKIVGYRIQNVFFYGMDVMSKVPLEEKAKLFAGCIRSGYKTVEEAYKNMTAFEKKLFTDEVQELASNAEGIRVCH